MEPRFLYAGENRRTLSFPIGGIGSGCVGLDGTGRLCDWEIFNRPAKGSLNGFTHFAVKAERDGRVIDARALNSDLLPPYTGMVTPGSRFANFGFGPPRELMCGLPHFSDSAFYGRFPLAEVQFFEPEFPGRASLAAFNPFIPLDDESSSLPAAFFTVCIQNTGDAPIDYTAALTLSNPAKSGCNNHLVRTDGVAAMVMDTEGIDSNSPEYGQLVMAAVDEPGLHYQRNWYRGNWFDNLGVFWREFTAPGKLRDREYDSPGTAGQPATLCVTRRCQPGKTAEFRFVLAWYYPNCANYWNAEKCACGNCAPERPRTWKNYYASLFDGAPDVARRALHNWNDLYSRTREFADALYASDLPPEAIEAVGANLAVLKSPTCLRLSDGSFYGFEGCHCSEGCCEGSCTHVWNYAFALPYLFPKLERSMRELDYTYNLREDGGMPFRLQLPLGRDRSAFRPCVDGQMGGVIKTWREWKLGAGDGWLNVWWPKAKKSLEFAFSSTNYDRWDPDKTGIISGRQHHTLDMELFGPNSWLTGFYLAALTAGAEMADAVGDHESAALYRALCKSGQAYLERELFNGEYYFQKIDLRDPSVLAPFSTGAAMTGGSTLDAYWNEEAGQLKYQIGEGCAIDQVLAQWMCDLIGLGDVFDREHVNAALGSIYRYNFKPSFRNHFNPCRIFCLNDEAGTVICEWPEGREKPVVPVPYSEETMHGFEYQAASHIIARGMEAEGLQMVRAIRDRYDGAKRNPWNEFECGSNYARSMASYALLLVYSGFACDASAGRMGMKPLKGAGRFLWSMSDAWGVMEISGSATELHVLGGRLRLRQWVLPRAELMQAVGLNGASVAFHVERDALVFAGEICIYRGDVLRAKT